MKEEPKDIKIIFSEALEKKTPQERAAYLERACGDDTNLRAKVEDLLKAHEEAGSFLDAPPFDPNVTLSTSPLTEGPGTIIGRYKLLEQIGEGGFGVVYMAEQQEPIRRRVALKIIKLGMDTRQVIARFEAERQALAMMEHPNIAKVLDAGATDTGRPYFVMELVKGIPITEYCDKNNLDTQQRLELFIDVCKAVQHAHQKGIIHRDIKPTNVMITLHDGKPVPKVIDFGIAKATSHRLTEKTLFTKYAQMIGTPEYMSPEQAEMSGLDIDTRTDIYSLGVLLYELLTSATPFDAKELREAGYIQMQRIIRETEPLRPSTKLNTMGDALTDIAKHRQSSPALLPKLVRGDLDWIAMKTLEKDRTRRYETASELAMDIQRHLSNEPVEASPPSTLYWFRKLVQKHRRTVAAVITIAATLIIGLVVSSSMYFLANRARKSEAVARTQAEQAKKAEQEQRKLAETKAEDYRRLLYVNSIQLADAKYRDRDTYHIREVLDACPNDLRGWEWDYLRRISDPSLMTFQGDEEPSATLAISVSPDGNRIVSASFFGTIKIWDAVTGAEVTTIHAHEGPIFSVSFSPDAKRIVSGSEDRTIKLWDVITGAEIMTLRGHEGRISSVSFSPDGKRIISGSKDKTIKIWDAVSGAEEMTLKGHKGPVVSIAVSPDGKKILSGGMDSSIKLWDAATGAEVMTLAGHKGAVSSVSFSPDGKKILSGDNDGAIKLWDAVSGVERMTLRGHSHEHGQLPIFTAFSPDGKSIVSSGFDRTVKVWDAESGTEVTNIFVGLDEYIGLVKFTPDGTRIVGGGMDKPIKIWDAAIKPEVMTLWGHKDNVFGATFSLDGKLIVSGSKDKTVKVWEAATGAEVMTLIGHGGAVYDARFSPDGNQIISGSADHTIKLWDAKSGSEVKTLQGHDGGVNRVAFNPDGSRIASASTDKTVKLWAVETGAAIMTLEGHERDVGPVSFSADGKHIVSGSMDETIKVWDASTGSEVMTLRGHKSWISWAVFTPDGKCIVSSAYNGTLKIWDTVSGTEVKTLRGHGGQIFCSALSPDGRRIVSGGDDNLIKVWDVLSGAEVMTLHGHDGAVRNVAFSPDGKRILSASDDKTIKVWESTVPPDVYGPRINAETARKVVDELYQKQNFYYDVIDKIQADKTLNEQVRKLALQIANSRKWEDGEKLKERSWEVVRLSVGDPNAYRAALANAEKANTLEPNDPSIFNLLGAAQYRVGSYEDALKTLTNTEKTRTGTDKIRTDTDGKSNPTTVAFMAMALHKLGRTEEAKVALDQLRDLLKKEQFAQDEKAKACLAEAEKLIEGEKQPQKGTKI